MNLEEFRNEYVAQGLHEEDLLPEPFGQFEAWFRQALDAQIDEPNAMVLATVDGDGRPSQRTVLLKFFDLNGFVFYTNYESRKSRQIGDNPRVSLLFFWKEFHRQVHITGRAEKVDRLDSLRYFASRPRGSQIGAWVSAQSSIISSRSLLLSQFEKMKARFANGEVPMPDYWGGYRVVPDSFEFWQGRVNRLHDRFLYHEPRQGAWRVDRLAP
jgi:pyridoxamine 5'-phosphate oxidase